MFNAHIIHVYQDRKQIVKAIKPYVERMSQEELAQLVLFSAFDIIEYAALPPSLGEFLRADIAPSSDTKLVAKSLISELTAAAPTIWNSTHGRRSLLYLISPRSRRHFTPAQIVTLEETDVTKAQTSKKDDSVRVTEIRKAASEPLLEFVAKHGKEAAVDTGGSLLVGEIMLQADGGTYFRNFLPYAFRPHHGKIHVWLTLFGCYTGQRLTIWDSFVLHRSVRGHHNPARIDRYPISRSRHLPTSPNRRLTCCEVV